jgi:TPR repeat protein
LGFRISCDAPSNFIIAAVIAGTPAAGPIEDGMAAYRRGDCATAMRLLRPIADHGDAGAPFDLGVMYDKGQGVSQDYMAAGRWYRKVADQEFADAQSNLGLMYKNGRGVPQDYLVAHMWYNLAAAGGSQAALGYRDSVAARMTPAQIAEAQKRAAEWRPKIANASSTEHKQRGRGRFCQDCWRTRVRLRKAPFSVGSAPREAKMS